MTASDSPVTHEYEEMEEYRPLPRRRDDTKKIACGVCALLLGSFGIHKFLLGQTTAGLVMLLTTLCAGFLTFGFAAGVMHIIGLVEGVIYLTKSDEEFHQIYEVEGKA